MVPVVEILPHEDKDPFIQNKEYPCCLQLGDAMGHSLIVMVLVQFFGIIAAFALKRLNLNTPRYLAITSIN